MSFDRLGLAPEFLRAVADQGYTEPTPVQAEAIPLVLDGRDLMAGAQTGTGKTAAFVLPMLQRLGPPDRDPRAARRPIRALVLAPTRELALQVEASVRVYGRHWGYRSTAIYGGVGFSPQVASIRNGVDVVVATPGRLLDHLGQRTIDLSAVEILVLDEADRMLDMGFIRDIRKVLAVLPPRRQNLLFSATFSDDIRSLASGFLHDPATVQVTPRNSAAPLVTQVVHPVDRERKRELLAHLIRSGAVDQALVFTRTKHGANRLAQQLEREGIAAMAIHGNKSQTQRVRALADFKAGRMPILVATEIAARGLDIDGLPHVVNFELPMVPEDYVHRIGRTGRAGSPGHAISLVCVDEERLLRDIERVLGRSIEQVVVEGFEPDRSIRPEPILRGGLGRARPEPRGERVVRAGAAHAGANRGRGGVGGDRPERVPSREGGPRPPHRDGVGLGEAGPRRPVPSQHGGPGRPPQAARHSGPPGSSGRPGQPGRQTRPGQGLGNAPVPQRSGPGRRSESPRADRHRDGRGRPAPSSGGHDPRRAGTSQAPAGHAPRQGDPRPSGAGDRSGAVRVLPGERIARSGDRPA